LHSKDPINSSIIIDQIHNALEELQQNRIIHTIQYDTYQREIERYGSITMEFSETVFFHDSKTVINFLNLIEGEEGEQYRWLFAIRGVDQLLEDFALSLDQKIALIDNARHGFFAEFNGDDNLKHNLDNKYRKIGRLLSTFLSPENDTLEIREATNLFDARSSAVKVAYANLKLEYQNKGINMGIETIIQNVIPSYLHMFLNRIFIANQRLHELVVYHYLSKYYKSISARSKQNKLPIVNQEQK
jgi:thiopeptide-type bacteriocin biosynthesis protein